MLCGFEIPDQGSWSIQAGANRHIALGELLSAQSFTLYTYSHPSRGKRHWHDAENGNPFFESEEAVRRVVIELRADVSDDPETEWPEMRIERIETVPITRSNLLALLNDGVGAIVQKYEIIGIIGKEEP